MGSPFRTQELRSTRPRRASSPRRGLDFLSFNVRRYHGKLLIKPSTAAVQRIRTRLVSEVKALRGANTAAVLRKLNPIVRGWAAYYRGVVSTETFQKLDHHGVDPGLEVGALPLFEQAEAVVVDRYFGRFHPTGHDRWVFNRDSGAYLHQFALTRIVRHDLVKGAASPDDPP
jgi:RNA-directed DNA polymerase